jgi:hypothetical protein
MGPYVTIEDRKLSEAGKSDGTEACKAAEV